MIEEDVVLKRCYIIVLKLTEMIQSTSQWMAVLQMLDKKLKESEVEMCHTTEWKPAIASLMLVVDI